MEKIRRRKINLLFKIMIAMIFFGIFTFLGFFYYVYLSSPEFNTDLLYKKESSNIYDSKGELIATIGSEKREIVSYEELPQVLVDSIISIEDNRFFEHKGLDIIRFLNAGFSYIQGKDAGGASTLTMQVSKNSLTSTEASGFKGIIRKFTDIYLSLFKIEKDYSKKEIIEFYVNSPYLGGGSYGVEVASNTYFNKHVNEINLVEAATLAGLFQAPGKYDPYVNPELTNQRKNTVIDMMLKYGYISEDQADSAKKVDVEDIIVKNDGTINPYQGYIDTVIEEVVDRTGNNPYLVSMDIYTNMNRSKQDVINNFYKKHKFKDKKVQVGIAMVDNDTGAIVAVGAGRNKNSELSLNYATQIKRHPGSTAKPLFDYGPGIEYNNWSTYTPFVDKPVKYTYGGVMHNVDNAYRGFMTLKQCLVQSRNTCALQAFQKVKNSNINKFVTSLGITPEYLNKNSTYINEAHSIGGFTGVSPLELAGAYAAFGNGGYYTEPHTIKRIVYKSSNSEIVEDFSFNKKRVMKSSTAYMISYILKGVTPSSVKVKGTDLSCKTGTSSYDYSYLKKLGLPKSTIQDAWTVTFSPDYTVAIWYGYDKLTKKSHMSSSHGWSERRKIQREIVNKVMDKNSRFKKPSTVVSAKVVVGTNPPLKPNSTTPSSMIQTHLFVKGHAPNKTSTVNYAPKKTESSSSSETVTVETFTAQ